MVVGRVVVGRVVVGRLVVDRVVVCWVMLSQPRVHSIMIATHHGEKRGERCHYHHGIILPMDDGRREGVVGREVWEGGVAKRCGREVWDVWEV